MQGKIVIVTGASSGIGRAAAFLFANKGSTVVGVGRNEKELTALSKQVSSRDGVIKPYLADMTEMTQLERIIRETVANHGRIDVLVNSAGIIKNGTIETTTLDDWDKMMNINLRSVFALSQKALPYLIEAKGN